MTIKQIPVEEIQIILSENPNQVYIDVRTEQEFLNGHVPGAINIPAFVMNHEMGGMQPTLEEMLQQVVAKFDKNLPLIIGCQMGGRSQAACEFLQGNGYEDLINVSGGFGAWLKNKFPVEK